MRTKRVPQVDQEKPFCQDRQLTDAFEQMQFNKNPRLYEPTSQTRARRTASLYGKHKMTVTQLNEQSPLLDPHTSNGGRMAKHKRLSKALTHALSSIDGEGTPHLLSVASSSFAPQICPPLKTTESAPTFGHRPTSASRHFAPLSMSTQHSFEPSGGKSRRRKRDSRQNSQSIVQRRKPLLVAGTGMSLANLRNLLTGELDEEKKITAQSLGMSVEQLHQQEDEAARKEYLSQRSLNGSETSDELSNEVSTIFRSGASVKSRITKQKEDLLKAKRDGWDSELYYPPIVRPDVTNHGPDPGESYQERLLRFSKISAGVAMHPFCEDRQRNDAREMGPDINRDLPTRTHPYLPFSDVTKKSPRTLQSFEKTKQLMRGEEERQRRLERQVEKHERMVADDRIAKLAIR